MAILYSWSPGSRVTIPPQTVGEKLEELAQQHAVVTPELVLGEATNPGSPLHNYMNWDNESAAHQHRLTQARELMRFIYVQDTEQDAQPHRLFVSLRRADSIPQEELKKTYSLAIAGTGDGYVRLTSTPSQDQLRSRVVRAGAARAAPMA